LPKPPAGEISARIEAKVRRSVCGVHRAISRWSRSASSSLARSTEASTIVRQTFCSAALAR
jgi:hypothetical protein